MKKWIALLLAAVFVLALIGCGSKQEKDTAEKETQQTEQNTPSISAETPEPATEPDAVTPTAPATQEPEPTPEPEPEATEEPTPEPEPEATEEPTPEPEPLAIELPMTLIENDQCAVILTEIDPENMWGYTLHVRLENRTDDQKLMFSCRDCYVNGVEWDPLFASEVAAGKAALKEINFTGSEMKSIITSFTDIEMRLYIHDADDYMADAIVDETVRIYPLGEENAVPFVREAQPTDIVLADNDEFSVTVIGIDPDSFWGYAVKLYIVNKSDMALTFSADDVSVNGLMLDPYWATSLLPGKCVFTDLSWSSSDFEKNGITDVSEIELKLRVYDSNNWFDGYEFEQVITLNP